jgi:hypothetical protein
LRKNAKTLFLLIFEPPGCVGLEPTSERRKNNAYY